MSLSLTPIAPSSLSLSGSSTSAKTLIETTPGALGDLALEAGGRILLEDSSAILLEVDQMAEVSPGSLVLTSAETDHILLESGGEILLADGSGALLLNVSGLSMSSSTPVTLGLASNSAGTLTLDSTAGGSLTLAHPATDSLSLTNSAAGDLPIAAATKTSLALTPITQESVRIATLSTLQSDVAGVLGLDFDSGTPTNGDGPRLLGWANDAVIDMLRRTHVYIASATMTLTANVGDYTLDSAILAIEDIYMTSGGANFKMRRMSTTDLINERMYQLVTAPVTRYALNGANMIMFYPTPLQADTLTIYYVGRPTALASGTDDPSSATLGGIPSEYHYGLELYMMWKAADAFDDESSSSGETYRRMYLGDPTAPPGTEQRDGFIGTMKKDIRKKGGKHLPGVVLPPRTRRTYLPLPGVDMGSQYY